MVGKEAGRRVRGLQHLNNITGLYLYNLDNVESVEEAEMTILENKQFLRDLSFDWKQFEQNQDVGRDMEYLSKVIEAFLRTIELSLT